MRDLETARAMIHARPDGDAEQTLRKVIAALETNSPLDVGSIYELDYDSFELVIDLLRGWRLHRYGGVARNGVAEEGIPYMEKRHNA